LSFSSGTLTGKGIGIGKEDFMVFFLGLACVFGGFIMVAPLFMEKSRGLKLFDEKITPYKIIIGLAILIIGAIKFFAPYHGGGKHLIPVFGDLLPSATAILVGIFISLDFLESLKGVKERVSEEGKRGFWTRLKSMLQRYQYPIGFASMFFGLLHWIMFRVIFF
jgi:hypothetical protein